MLSVFPQQSIKVFLFLSRSPYDHAPLFLPDRPMDNYLAEHGHDKEYDRVPHGIFSKIGTWQVSFAQPVMSVKGYFPEVIFRLAITSCLPLIILPFSPGLARHTPYGARLDR